MSENKTPEMLVKFIAWMLAVGVSFVIGYFVAAYQYFNEDLNGRAALIGAPVHARVCHPTGCSFLAELPDQSRKWIWIAKPIQPEK